ncbi:elongation factor Ts [bacterium (Candidatus Gribaldobacteria) CG_4_9_14_3_um_filter_36_15]|uniref:Elongation factor Ts n=4 Tax=Candidatus Gribaldobacteria TaxID=2798536 RepID=A0A2M7VJL4_9BACT|nr:MAG: elongation factor Ts [Parcubacteria group bacterium CG2_30_36_21]PIR91014.1 MAG: elongation factor Ts [bacterium (Candidatus Gribaldobacteria) CG10_big_fil_rev_8_21_14_0_10_37_46]PIV14128.1 MAG: elongation factor Ts [bacterium (Candidatus Gribaldobacteria) CG03_land_8_20_14_0_80_36_40]PJA02041.1 MAG: elongation factor Ts [bacterium (Candidatus Gribaldobacteria) CG_4_10_14_0_2_um_filter_36_18]PJB09299.1 MAG: elongation factor Ts [bacterium (Candidatus Gribaldobacteria) CG_4_9_14_3_um_fil
MTNIDQLKQLRQETGVSFLECKNALEEAKGDIKEAKRILREKGKEIAESKVLRKTEQGIIESYLHPGGKIGVLLEVCCESDFVAKSGEFKKLAHEICLQITAMKPLFLDEKDISEEFLDGEKKIYQKQFEGSGKPQKVIDQIIEGKLSKYKREVSLLNQPWVRDEEKTIKDLINEYSLKLGENIKVKRFARYEI